MITSKAILLAALIMGAAATADARQTAGEIARRVVVGQAYPSGNVYVAGFIEDEPRPWPPRIVGVPFDADRTGRIAADFFRIVAQDSEEQYYFPQREADASDDDVFSTIDQAAIEDRNLARYRALGPSDKSVAFFGWDERLALTEVSHRDGGQLRPTTLDERTEIEVARKSMPKDFGCTTNPRFLDAAKVILTATIAKSQTGIRLSTYETPGCAGHLSKIYVLDVITPGREPRRFEFRHYQGVL